MGSLTHINRNPIYGLQEPSAVEPTDEASSYAATGAHYRSTQAVPPGFDYIMTQDPLATSDVFQGTLDLTEGSHGPEAQRAYHLSAPPQVSRESPSVSRAPPPVSREYEHGLSVERRWSPSSSQQESSPVVSSSPAPEIAETYQMPVIPRPKNQIPDDARWLRVSNVPKDTEILRVVQICHVRGLL